MWAGPGVNGGGLGVRKFFFGKERVYFLPKIRVWVPLSIILGVFTPRKEPL